MNDSHDNDAQDLARAELNDVTALEASAAAISAQIAATERKIANVVALLNGLRLQLELFTENRMADIRKYLAYRDCTKTDQVAHVGDLFQWRHHTHIWDSSTRRQFQDTWSAIIIVTSARTCEKASRAIRRAMDNLSQFKNTSKPFDDVLKDRARHEVFGGKREFRAVSKMFSKRSCMKQRAPSIDISGRRLRMRMRSAESLS